MPILASAAPAGTEAVRITAINQESEATDKDRFRTRDAVFFVHGIYGDKDTFKNGDFYWPSELAKELNNELDIYAIEYHTKLLSWLKRDIAAFDDVSGALFEELHGHNENGLLSKRPYRSVGFIAHSLGGNVTAAYIHTVKSALGHVERAKNSFLITLGTPANGAQIANVAALIKNMLGMQDPLLQSLERDNTFVRMLATWRNAETDKAARLQCRPVNLYVGVEGTSMYGMTIVSRESAARPYIGIANEVKLFAEYDHSQLAKPVDQNDPVFVWVRDIIKNERKRMDEWTGPLCRAL